MHKQAKTLLEVMNILLFPVLLFGPLVMFPTVSSASALQSKMPLVSVIFLWVPYIGFWLASKFGSYSEEEIRRRETFRDYYPLIMVPPYVLFVAVLFNRGWL